MHKDLYKVTDLFAGCGGMSLGFSMAKFDITSAVEIDKWAAETYAENFGSDHILTTDITKITNEELSQGKLGFPDIIVGGPPCQGFSVSNSLNKDINDPRNSLFRDFIRVAGVLRPKICVIENVKGLLSTKTTNDKRVIDIIVSEFKKIGFKTEYKLLNAANYGVPQIRERLFIVAVREDVQTAFSWPVETHSYSKGKNGNVQLSFQENQYVSLWDSLSDLNDLSNPKNASLPYQSEPKNDYQRYLRSKKVSFILNHEPMKHTTRIIERFKQIGFGESEASVAHELRPRRRGESTEISGNAFSQNSRRQLPDLPCNTVVSSSHTNFIHPFLHRNFTVRELARIQSFPDNFIFKGKRAVLSKSLSIKKGYVDDIYLDQRMQIGNAVPPLLAKAIALEIRKVLENEEKLSGEKIKSIRSVRGRGGDVARA